MSTEVRRLFVLPCGYEIIPLSVSLRHADPALWIAVPITAYLLDTARGWVLFDAGLDEGHLRDPERLQALFLSKGWDPPPLVRPEHELGAQLRRLGLDFADIGTVILSHLHADHAGHLKALLHADWIVQRAEHAYAHSGTQKDAWFPCDYDLPGARWSLIEGDHEVMSGLTCLATPGHSPGHQSLLMDLPHTGRCVLAADVGDLRENFAAEVLPGESADDAAALASLQRLSALEAEGATLFLTHDPDQRRVQRLTPAFYD